MSKYDLLVLDKLLLIAEQILLTEFIFIVGSNQMRANVETFIQSHG